MVQVPVDPSSATLVEGSWRVSRRMDVVPNEARNSLGGCWFASSGRLHGPRHHSRADLNAPFLNGLFSSGFSRGKKKIRKGRTFAPASTGVGGPPPVTVSPIGQRLMGETKWEKEVETASCDFLRFSAVFCSFLRLQTTYTCRSRTKSAEICESLRQAAVSPF